MDYIIDTMSNLIHQTAFFNLTWGNYILILVAFVFMYLAIAKGFEPLLLVPISFGMLLVNMFPDIMITPEESSNGVGGLLYYFYVLDEWSIFPSLIFMGVGAMTDFGPLIANPSSFLMGAAASLVFMWRTSSPSSWASMEKRRLPSPSSAAPTAPHPSSFAVSWDRQSIWVPLPWRHILICLWCPSFSRPSCGC